MQALLLSEVLNQDSAMLDHKPTTADSLKAKILWAVESATTTRAALQAAAGFKSASGVSEWIRTGRIDKQHLPKIAKLTGTKLEWWLTADAPIPPTRDWLDSTPAPAETDGRTSTSVSGPTHAVLAWSEPSDLPDNEFALVERRTVKLAAGNGHFIFEDEPLPPLAFRAEFLRARRVTRRDNLVIVYAEGDSMEPSILDGDSLLCDRGQVDVIDGEVYAIDYGGHLRVKRLHKRFDGALIIRSDNAAKYPVEIVTTDDLVRITILGRVLWRGGSI